MEKGSKGAAFDGFDGKTHPTHLPAFPSHISAFALIPDDMTNISVCMLLSILSSSITGVECIVYTLGFGGEYIDTCFRARNWIGYIEETSGKCT